MDDPKYDTIVVEPDSAKSPLSAGLTPSCSTLVSARGGNKLKFHELVKARKIEEIKMMLSDQDLHENANLCINFRDPASKNNTPLHLAAEMENAEGLLRVLGPKACLTLKNSVGWTAFQTVLIKNQFENARILYIFQFRVELSTEEIKEYQKILIDVHSKKYLGDTSRLKLSDIRKLNENLNFLSSSHYYFSKELSCDAIYLDTLTKKIQECYRLLPLRMAPKTVAYYERIVEHYKTWWWFKILSLLHIVLFIILCIVVPIFLVEKRGEDNTYTLNVMGLGIGVAASFVGNIHEMVTMMKLGYPIIGGGEKMLGFIPIEIKNYLISLLNRYDFFSDLSMCFIFYYMREYIYFGVYFGCFLLASIPFYLSLLYWAYADNLTVFRADHLTEFAAISDYMQAIEVWSTFEEKFQRKTQIISIVTLGRFLLGDLVQSIIQLIFAAHLKSLSAFIITKTVISLFFSILGAIFAIRELINLQMMSSKNIERLKNIYTNLKEPDYKNKLDIAKQLLNIYETKYGEKHPATAEELTILAKIYAQTEMVDLAIKHEERALTIFIALYGENSEYTAATYTNISALYKDKKEYIRALEIQFKSLNVMLTLFGENHHYISASYNNIGAIYDSLGQSEKALKFQEMALELNRNLYGENHKDTIASYMNLGSAYSTAADSLKGTDEEGSNKLFQKASTFHERALFLSLQMQEGNNNNSASTESIALCYHNAAATMADLGENRQALEYEEKALRIYKEIYGKHHPKVANTCFLAGQISQNMKNYSSAIFYFAHCYKIRKKVLKGEDSEEIAECLEALSSSYSEKGEYDKSTKYQEEASAIRLHLEGETMKYADSLYRLAVDLSKINENSKALQYAEQAEKIFTERLGEVNEKSAKCLQIIGKIQEIQGDKAKAIEVLEKEARIMEENSDKEKDPMLGVRRYITLTKMAREIGQREKAERFIVKAKTLKAIAEKGKIEEEKE